MSRNPSKDIKTRNKQTLLAYASAFVCISFLNLTLRGRVASWIEGSTGVNDESLMMWSDIDSQRERGHMSFKCAQSLGSSPDLSREAKKLWLYCAVVLNGKVGW